MILNLQKTRHIRLHISERVSEFIPVSDLLDEQKLKIDSIVY
jgi:hypothetical protein